MSKVLTNNGLSRVIVNIKDLINNHTHKEYLPLSGGIVNNIVIVEADNEARLTVKNNHTGGGLVSSKFGKFGLYDDHRGVWVLGSDTTNGSMFYGTSQYLAEGANTLPMKFTWSGKPGQPGWVWGGNGLPDMYIYNPAEFTVKCAEYLGSYVGSAMYVYDSNKWALGAVYTESSSPIHNSVSLGSPAGIWSTVYAGTPAINTSDRNLKDNITSLLDNDTWIKFFMKLNPVSYIFKDNTSGRTHVGFISQDVEDIMNELGMSSLDFAGFCKDLKTETITEEITTTDENGEEITSTVTKQVPVLDENGNEQYIYSLRYSEFIAINTHIIQLQQKEIENINDRLSIIESKLVNL